MTYFFIFLTPLVNLALFELFFFKAGFFYLSLGLSVILLLAAVRRSSGKKINDPDFWSFCILPVIFSGAVNGYSLLVVNHYLVQALFALNFLFTFYYLKNIYRGVKAEFLENISAYGNFIAVFFIAAVVYGLEAFLNAPIWILILASSAAVILIVYQIFWANNIIRKETAVYILIVCLLMTQLAWSIYFLPFNYNALGLILAICFYVLIGLIKTTLAGKFNSRQVKLYLISGLGSLLIILLTTKWV